MGRSGSELTGRVALVTGATGGLGPGIVRALGAAGARLALASLPGDEALGALATELGARAFEADLADVAGPGRLVAAVTSGVGPVDILVNNAGVEITAPHARVPVDRIEALVRVNLSAPLTLSRLVLPGMLERRWGRVIGIASVAGRAFPPYLAAYGATKAGLIAFTHALNGELRGTGVRASAIVPGFVRESGMFHRRFEPAGARVPGLLGMAAAESVAAAVVVAARTGRAEILVNPGPARYVAALARAYPGFAAWLGRVIGVHGMLRDVAAGWREEGER